MVKRIKSLVVDVRETDETIDLSDMPDIKDIYVYCNVDVLPVFVVDDKYTDLNLTLDGEFKKFSLNLSNILKHFKNISIINNKHFKVLEDNCVVDSKGQLLGIINGDNFCEGIKSISYNLAIKYPISYTISLPKSLEILDSDFYTSLGEYKSIRVNSNIINSLRDTKIPSKDSFRLEKEYLNTGNTSFYDEIIFNDQKYINDDWYYMYHESTLLYCNMFKMENNIASNMNIGLFLGFVFHDDPLVKTYEFYKFYKIHEHLIKNKLNIIYKSKEISVKLNKLIKFYNTSYKNTKLNITKEEIYFKNTFIYKEYNDHFDILALNTIDSIDTTLDELYIPSIVNNKYVNLPFYFHINPLYDNSNIQINKLIIDGNFKTIHTYFFPFNDHSGQTNINEFILNNGIKRLNGLLNKNEEYTTVNKLYIPSSLSYIKDSVLTNINEVIIDDNNKYFKLDSSSSIINLKDNKTIIFK